MSDTAYRPTAARTPLRAGKAGDATRAKKGLFRTANDLLHTAFGAAHYDTATARKNPRPIRTWTPNGWC
ncbi:hypothetical protein A33M_0318 [Rhodovulum sp. PH10]|uniref:hypothetical protein n=1 Tax=Rhodovulum sp. PH10 TaxID=1187851 RepID=UPI00027C216E|nr:hypothetical protein [Rhodovulum sp. PH10]EJW13159.1 hypothetical protein A33M_0318 [Rhodovulum sp. PH10]